jgi:hypothetical protein
MVLSFDLNTIYLGYCTALLLLYCSAWFHLEISNGDVLVLTNFLRINTQKQRSSDSHTMNCYEEGEDERPDVRSFLDYCFHC